MTWRKSSRSGADGCVEVAVDWRRPSQSESSNCVEVGWHKSSYSAESANCLEIRSDADVHVRDSKDPAGPVLRFDRGEWAAFVAGVKAGDFDAV